MFPSVARHLGTQTGPPKGVIGYIDIYIYIYLSLSLSLSLALSLFCIYIYMHAVELLSGPSLTLLMVINWAKFVFY